MSMSLGHYPVGRRALSEELKKERKKEGVLVVLVVETCELQRRGASSLGMILLRNK